MKDFLSDFTKLIVTEYAELHYTEYLKFLDEWFLDKFDQIRPEHDEGSVYTMLWFYECNHPMEDL